MGPEGLEEGSSGGLGAREGEKNKIKIATQIMSRKRDWTKPRPLALQSNRPAAPSTVAADNRTDERTPRGRHVWGSGEFSNPDWKGGSGHWLWQVTLARLFLALACVVLFNYALFKKERKKTL